MDDDVVNAKKGHGAKKKTPFQLQSLEKFYAEDKYPQQKAMEEYATSLDLTYNSIRIWFVERRRKERRQNEARGCSKSLPGGKRVELDCGAILAGNGTNGNSALGHGRLKASTNSKYNRIVNHSDRSKDSSIWFAGKSLGRQSGKSSTSHGKCRSLFAQEEMRQHTYSKCRQPCDLMSNRFGKKYHAMCSNRQHVDPRHHSVQLQVLFSKEYILKSIFRKDGPPLGVEFDPLPMNAFGYRTGAGNLHSCLESQRNPKRRKVLGSPVLDSGTIQARNVPAKKYGIGKGLMTLWHATKSSNAKLPSGINFVGGSAAWTPFRSSLKETLRRGSKGMQELKLVPKRRTYPKKSQEKRKPPMKKKKVCCSNDANQKKLRRVTCKLFVDEPSSLESSNALIQLVDDEELELRELQEGPNPLRCSAHLSSNGRHGCPLCKDLLARFPPQRVKMKRPVCSRPWDSSPELVKKLFKIFRYMYGNAATIEICPFTLEEFAQAFTDKDSMLLGKIHVALLKLILMDVEWEMAAGLIHRSSKNSRFLGFMNFVREQQFDVSFWSRSLNSLTWTEILRQVLVAAGFGSKPNSIRRETFNKERHLMAKYGLRPRTLKGELFSMLFEQGSGGLKVTELARASQIVALDDLPNATEELEQLICLTLSSDITLFEKIAPSAYRLRVNPQLKGKDDYESDIENSGSVDDESGDTSTSSSSDESDESELDSALHRQRIVKYRDRHKKKGQKLTEYTEIDESYSGEAWVLGLMEGEYSNLSIDEKLQALGALVELAGAGSSLRTEEPVREVAAIIPNVRYHGSGAKIKKSSANHQVSQALWKGPTHAVAEMHTLPLPFRFDSSATFTQASQKGHSFRTKSTAAKESQFDVHPMQSIYLGSDRRYNSYWLFLGPCDGNDPGHRRIYFESSEDGHWEMIDTAEALEALLSSLDCRGTREARLFASLDEREVFLCQNMDDYVRTEYSSRQTGGCEPSELDTNSKDGSSPISDVDNILAPAESANSFQVASGAIDLGLGKTSEEKKLKWERLQAFDKWIWNSFYSTLNAVRKSRRSYMESLARCESCHDLYWRDEKHCRICHTTFELDFDLEERYAIHVATCRDTEDSCEFPKHKVLPSKLQALKAAIHAIEAGMPETALSEAWRRSDHKFWVRRLRRTSSLPELLQVLANFVGAIKEEWLYECSSTVGSSTALDEIVIYFQTLPQTTSAVALWMVKLDTLIAPHLEKLQSEQTAGSGPQLKRRRVDTR